MKKEVRMLLCLVLCMLILSVCGSGQPGNTAEAAGYTLKPLAATVIVQPGVPRITKNPTDEWVAVNGRCQFVSRYENAINAEWHFVSPDGKRDLTYVQAQKEFPSLKIIMGNTKDMTLDNIPQSLSGWRVYCRFSNNVGSANTGSALITVLPGPENYGLPWPTGNTMIVYYIDGTTERVSEYSDSTWKTSGGTVYYLGTDGILRARGGGQDLYTYNPASGDARPTGNNIIAYYASGATVYLYEYGDGSWRTSNGVFYYKGSDGIWRGRNAPDLYAYNPSYYPYTPSGGTQPSGNTMIAYYSSGTAEILTSNSDGTWRTSNGVTYYMGTDGVLRAKNAPDLYTYNPYNPYYPSGSTQPAGNGRIAYYNSGSGEYVTDCGDGTWRTASGTLYYMGDDGVLRARGHDDLHFR